MLPNLKLVICGILFCILLFAVAGIGVMRPESRTHVGEMPEVGRPMMQRSMADASSQAQVYSMTVARRSDELDRLRVSAAAETAAAPPEPEAQPDTPKPDLSQPDGPKPDSVATAASGDAVTANPAVIPVPDGTSDGAASIQAASASPAPAAETQSDDPADEAGRQQLATPAAAEESAAIPRFVNVPLPTPRPAVFGGWRQQAHLAQRRHRLVQQYGTAIPGTVPSSQAPVAPGVAAVYKPPESR